MPEPVPAAPEAVPPMPEPAAAAPPAAPASDGEQPTEVLRSVDEDAADPAADGEAEAVAHRTGERSEP